MRLFFCCTSFYRSDREPVTAGCSAEWPENLLPAEKFHPTEPHCAALAVDPAAQGKGLGGRLFGRFLADVDTRNETVYLESSNPKNHSFYAHHGFTVVEEFRYAPEAPTIWCMLRRAAGNRS